MAESFRLFISGLDPISLAVLVLGIFGVLILLPKAITESGIKKLGPIQMEQENQTVNHLTQRAIEAIDIQQRENLWEMTEDMLFDKLSQSRVLCHLAAMAIAHSLLNPLRNLILLNHIAPKLDIHEEEFLLQKIKRSVQKASRETRPELLPTGCPSVENIKGFEPGALQSLLQEWLKQAREITAKSCLEKMKQYNKALEQTRDKHWKEVFTSCYDKNLGYIEAMGFIVNKNLQLEWK